MKTLKIKVTFTEEVLGTSSNNPEIHSEFIAINAPDGKKRKEELEALPTEEQIEKAMTVFPRENGVPFIWDYQFKGFFKDTCSALARVKGSKSAGLKAFKKIIDGVIFPEPRKIMLQLPKGTKIGSCQRPLRGQTAQGERISLANSETVPIGTTCELSIVLFEDSLEAILIEWLDYGRFKGMLQWRNSGKGRFTYEVIE